MSNVTLEVRLTLILIVGTALLFWIGEDVAYISNVIQSLHSGVPFSELYKTKP